MSIAHGPEFLAAVASYTAAHYDHEIESARDALAFRYWRRAHSRACGGRDLTARELEDRTHRTAPATSAYGAHACAVVLTRYRADRVERSRAALTRATRALEDACQAPTV